MNLESSGPPNAEDFEQLRIRAEFIVVGDRLRDKDGRPQHWPLCRKEIVNATTVRFWRADTPNAKPGTSTYTWQNDHVVNIYRERCDPQELLVLYRELNED